MFKYDFGTRLRQGLQTYTVVGHATFADDTRAYILSFWLAPGQGYGNSTVTIDSNIVEDEREVKVLEDK